MAKKAVLFLSPMGETAREASYQCPDGKTSVTGKQTNEAPLKWLLHQHQDLSEVLCLVTPKARETAWAHLQDSIQAEGKTVEFRLIPMENGEMFSQNPLSQILRLVSSGDQILLETTGGPRNAVMDILLLSRVLSYVGVETIGAVYSNFQAHRIEDISGLIGQFDLVNGMQELTSFGSAKTLQAYYQSNPVKDPRISKLLTATENLTEQITLCRTQNISAAMDRFNRAMSEAEACEDPLLAALIPAFRQKFHGEMTTPGLIAWCIESDMIQQALTIYKERVPAYLLLERGDLVRLKDSFAVSSEEEATAQFKDGLKKMAERASRSFSPWLKEHPRKDDSWDERVAMLDDTRQDNFRELLKGSCFKATGGVDCFRKIVMDYYYIRALRNMVNHANADSQESDQLLEYLSDTQRRKDPAAAKVADIKRILTISLEHLNL